MSASFADGSQTSTFIPGDQGSPPVLKYAGYVVWHVLSDLARQSVLL